MSPWLRILEGWMVARVPSATLEVVLYADIVPKLLASPTFHRLVERAQKRLRRIRHGPDPEDMGGTNIEQAGEQGKKFLDHYLEELKDQFRGGSGSKR